MSSFSQMLFDTEAAVERWRPIAAESNPDGVVEEADIVLSVKWLATGYWSSSKPGSEKKYADCHFQVTVERGGELKTLNLTQTVAIHSSATSKDKYIKKISQEIGNQILVGDCSDLKLKNRNKAKDESKLEGFVFSEEKEGLDIGLSQVKQKTSYSIEPLLGKAHLCESKEAQKILTQLFTERKKFYRKGLKGFAAMTMSKIKNVVRYLRFQGVCKGVVFGKSSAALGLSILDCKGEKSQKTTSIKTHRLPFGLTWESKKKTSHFYEVGEKENPKVRVNFINGILESKEKSENNAKIVSNALGGAKVHGVYNASQGVHDIVEAGLGQLGVVTEPVDRLHESWNAFFDQEGLDSDAILVQVCHSQGATHTRNALIGYDEEKRKRIHVIAVAPASYISNDLCGKVVHLVSNRDIVPLIHLKGARRCPETTVILERQKDTSPLDHHLRETTYTQGLHEQLAEYQHHFEEEN